MTTSTLTAIDAEALRTHSRADFVYESLRDAIWDGRIAVGERVREEEIARNLGVSRTPVREAGSRPAGTTTRASRGAASRIAPASSDMIRLAECRSAVERASLRKRWTPGRVTRT